MRHEEYLTETLPRLIYQHKLILTGLEEIWRKVDALETGKRQEDPVPLRDWIKKVYEADKKKGVTHEEFWKPGAKQMDMLLELFTKEEE